ncbi:MAG TPA: DNA recombination protein RmuC [Longimicrobiales bacterium]|nr:DNA recombination protein RmuC [Longimicrobiales bacterium]
MNAVLWILIVAVAALVAAVLFLFVRLSRRAEEQGRLLAQALAAAGEPAAKLESKVEVLTQQLGQRLGESSEAAHRIAQLVQAELASTRGSLTQQIDANNQALTAALGTTHASLSQLQERLGRLDEATRQVEQVGKSISGLEQLFASPKMRGGIGEWALEMLLTEVLPGDSVLRQHRLASRGVVVDFAVRAADDRIISIDSKFPLEAFRRLVAAEADGAEDAKRLRSEFERSVKARVDEIAGKYISPDDGTLDYALMYLPSEAIYYELAVRDEGAAFIDYARNRHVVPCSPNTLYAYLQAIALGLRGLQMTEQVRWIQGMLQHLRQDAGAARDAFEKTQKQLMYAANNLGEVGSSLGRIEERLEHIDDAREGDPAALPPAERQIRLETPTLFG